jgi:hypothetical protein
VATAPITIVVGADIAAGAGTVFDDHGAQAVLDLVGQCARRHVERAAGRVGDDQADRPGAGLRRRQTAQRGRGEQDVASVHQGVPRQGVSHQWTSPRRGRSAPRREQVIAAARVAKPSRS